MSAREQAIKDMLPELKERNKSFIAFRKELNSIMRRLVSQQIQQQKILSQVFSSPSKASTQLVAHCFFCKGNVEYSNYDKYYETKVG